MVNRACVEDIIVCPQILSTSSNPEYVQKYLSLGSSCMERHVILSISSPAFQSSRAHRGNVTECLDVSSASQYPDEQVSSSSLGELEAKEVLLPFLSVLRVLEISFTEGQPVRLWCQFQGHGASSKACGH